MAIDWVSILIGVGIGIFIANILTLVSSFAKYKKETENLKKVTEKMEKIRSEFQKQKEALIQKLEDTKKGEK